MVYSLQLLPMSWRRIVIRSRYCSSSDVVLFVKLDVVPFGEKGMDVTTVIRGEWLPRICCSGCPNSAALRSISTSEFRDEVAEELGYDR